jgi:hypothetical protein
MCRVPEEEWPGAGDQEVIDAIKLDFMGEWGDRELAFPLQGPFVLAKEIPQQTNDSSSIDDILF